MSKLKKEASHGWKGVYYFYCPGCMTKHYINTIQGEMSIPCWYFNGNVDNPTISPSLLVQYPTNDKVHICHSFIKNGRIEYLSDCTHQLAGQTIELNDI